MSEQQKQTNRQLQFDWDERTDFHRHIEHCSAVVKTWPLWKQNILAQSGSPTVPTPRTPITYEKTPEDSDELYF